MKKETISGIYCIENLINNKKYIGRGLDVERRMKRPHKECCYIYNSIKKYGKENFRKYIILYCEKEELNYYEVECIRMFHSYVSEKGYNISFGGSAPMEGRKHSEETKRKMVKSHSGKNNPNYGKPMSEEQKNKISESTKGNKSWNYGKKHKPETIEKMKLNNKRPSLGTKASDETKKRQSAASFGKPKKRKTNTPLKGVSFHRVSGKWRSRIFENRKETYLGLFLTDIEAGIVYDNYCWNKYKDITMLNFPERI